jgi:hypothetical protein
MQFKQVFRRMNLDSDCRSLQPGEYRKLYNAIPVSPKSSSYTNAIRDVLSNLFGHAIVSYSLPSGTNKCIGFLEDEANNRAFYFVYNNTAASNSIYRYENGSITLVFRSALLDFLATDLIDADIIGDILIFTNRRTETYKIDVVKAIAGATYTPLLEEITLIKRPPKLPLTFDAYTVLPNTDGFYETTTQQNFLAGNHFQFFYRYIYEDYSYSIFSPASKVNYSWSLPNSTAVKVVSGRGNISLTGVQTIDGYSAIAGTRVLVIAQTDPIENGVWVTAAGAWARAADFAAGNSYDLTYYVTGGLYYYFGTTWRVKTTNAGTTATYAAGVEGPNYFVVRNNETAPATAIRIEYAVRINGTNELFVYKIEKTGSYSVTHKFYNNAYLFTVPDAEAFKWNDSVPLVSKSLRIFKNRLFLFNNTEGFADTSTGAVTLSATIITAPVQRVYSVAKAGGRYNVGIVYTDGNSRISGVRHKSEIIIQDHIALRYRISVATAGLPSAPSWATHFRIVCTKSLNEGFFINNWTQDVYYYTKDVDGVYSYSKTIAASGVEGMAIDIGALTKINRGYTFSAGDRIKIYVQVYSDGTTTEITTVHDVEILAQDGNFVITKLINGLLLDTTRSSNYYFQIYTPKIITEELFYETGHSYAISALSGGPFELEGDCEIVNNILYRDVSGDYSNTDPFANVYEPSDVALQPVEVMNFWDKNYTIWVTHAGRGISGSDARQLLKISYVRYSNPYIQGGEVLGLNTFDALDDNPTQSENGDGVQLVETGDVLVALYETVSAALYIGEGFVSTTNDNAFLTKTDEVIGDDRNYREKYGCQDPATVVSKNGRVYFLDKQKGAVLRRSQDGLTVISKYGVQGEISTLCNTHSSLATSRIIGGWDPQYECYVLSFIDTSGPSGYTYYFHEDSNSWVCLSDLRPDYWGTLGQRQLAFTAGALYQQSIESNYNLFFGTQYNRRLEFEIGQDSLVKIWDAVEVDVDSIYTTAGTNEDILLLYLTNGGTLQTRINYADFQLKEGVYRSAFFRSLNDASMANVTESKYKSHIVIRSQSAFFVITNNSTSRNPMKSITIFYTPSMASNP